MLGTGRCPAAPGSTRQHPPPQGCPPLPAVGAEEDGLGVVLGQDLKVNNLRVQVPVKLHGQLLHVVAPHLHSAHIRQGGAGRVSVAGIASCWRR